MGRVERAVHQPDPGRADAYEALYQLYRELHDHFGRTPELLHRLRTIRNTA